MSSEARAVHSAHQGGFCLLQCGLSLLRVVLGASLWDSGIVAFQGILGWSFFINTAVHSWCFHSLFPSYLITRNYINYKPGIHMT